MDCSTEFFIASDDEVAAQVKGTEAGRAFESLPGGAYDPADVVVEWESLFTGAHAHALMQAGEPRFVTEVTNDGCCVFVVSRNLVTSLATSDRTTLEAIARQWAHMRQEDGEDIGEDEAVRHLGELARLAASAIRQGERLYCSVT
ncbi:hypothetical protein [Actinocatenispora rupis]|uniref:DUF1877 domain-containing protein n=1 Tax=Actinocatenispora rupis TaxID=519421 RepID=A0A8J3JC98_9ACTN|nr:hypothetical protein [Actinocatenispora rupis]GID14109.1 hypothetical protein Aru02nite_49980 [Actinocatenispora rupis]